MFGFMALAVVVSGHQPGGYTRNLGKEGKERVGGETFLLNPHSQLLSLMRSKNALKRHGILLTRVLYIMLWVSMKVF